jgi:hypothetical protein
MRASNHSNRKQSRQQYHISNRRGRVADMMYQEQFAFLFNSKQYSEWDFNNKGGVDPLGKPRRPGKEDCRAVIVRRLKHQCSMSTKF